MGRAGGCSSLSCHWPLSASDLFLKSGEEGKSWGRCLPGGVGGSSGIHVVISAPVCCESSPRLPSQEVTSSPSGHVLVIKHYCPEDVIFDTLCTQVRKSPLESSWKWSIPEWGPGYVPQQSILCLIGWLVCEMLLTALFKVYNSLVLNIHTFITITIMIFHNHFYSNFRTSSSPQRGTL